MTIIIDHNLDFVSHNYDLYAIISKFCLGYKCYLIILTNLCHHNFFS